MVQIHQLIPIVKKIAIKYGIYCTLQYFTDYYDRIHSYPNLSLTQKGLFLLYYSLSVYHISLHSFFFFFTSTLSRQTNLLLVNTLYFMELDPFHNVWAVGLFMMGIYFFYLFNTQNRGITAKILYQILLESDNSLFLNSVLTLRDFPLIKNLVLKRKLERFQQIFISEFLQKIAIYTRNILAIASFGLYLFCLQLCAQILYQLLIVERLFSQNYGIFLFIYFHLNSAFILVNSTLLMDICSLGATNIITLSVAGVILLEQIWSFLHAFKLQYFSQLRLGLFLKYNTDLLRILSDCNRLYGRAFFAFLLAVYPGNAAMVSIILFGGQPLFFKLAALILVIISCFFMFAMHFLVVRMSLRLHRPASRLLKVSLASKSIQSLGAKLKLANYLSAFITVNKYGLTYGNFGTVTYRSFERSLFFYFKFLVFGLKLFM